MGKIFWGIALSFMLISNIRSMYKIPDKIWGKLNDQQKTTIRQIKEISKRMKKLCEEMHKISNGTKQAATPLEYLCFEETGPMPGAASIEIALSPLWDELEQLKMESEKLKKENRNLIERLKLYTSL